MTAIARAAGRVIPCPGCGEDVRLVPSSPKSSILLDPDGGSHAEVCPGLVRRDGTDGGYYARAWAEATKRLRQRFVVEVAVEVHDADVLEAMAAVERVLSVGTTATRGHRRAHVLRARVQTVSSVLRDGSLETVWEEGHGMQ